MSVLLRSSSIVRRDPKVELLTTDGVSLLVDDSPTVRAINEVAASVWKQLDGRHSVATIVSTLGEEYEAAPEQIERDVLGFLNEVCVWRLAEVIG